MTEKIMPLSADEEKKDTLTNIEVEKILRDVQDEIRSIKYAHAEEELIHDEELVSAGSVVEINNIFENALIRKDTHKHLNDLMFDLNENVRQRKNIFEIEHNVTAAEDGVLEDVGEFLEIGGKNKEAKKNIKKLRQLEDDGVITEHAYDKLSQKISKTPEGLVLKDVEKVFDGFRTNELANASKCLPIADSKELKSALEDIKKPKEEEKEEEKPVEEEPEEIEEPEKEKEEKISFLEKIKKSAFAKTIGAKISKITDKIPFIKKKKKEVVEDNKEEDKDKEKEELDTVLAIPDMRRKYVNIKLYAKKKVQIDRQMTNAQFKEYLSTARIDENLRDTIHAYFDDYGASEYMGSIAPSEEEVKKLEKDTTIFIRKVEGY